MPSLFESDGKNLDLGYLNLRAGKSATERDIAAHLDAMWARCEPYADPDFRQSFARDPDARFFELVIGCALLDAGKTLRPTASRLREGGQPDFCVEDGERRIWIEAVVPTVGQGEDQVRGPVPVDDGGGFEPAPKREAQLRITTALLKKAEVIAGYLQQGVIAETDVRLIAIGGGHFGRWVADGQMPLILSAVFPVGDEFVTIDRQSGKLIDQGFKPSYEISRRRGAIPRTAFLEETFAHLSGVIWSRRGIGTADLPLVLVHNPKAQVAMPSGWGVWDKEFVAEQGEAGWTVRDIRSR